MSSPREPSREDRGGGRAHAGRAAAHPLLRAAGTAHPDRADNGYRTYTAEHVERVGRIAGLVQAGIPTRLVKVLLDAEDAAARDDLPGTGRRAAGRGARPLEARIACLTRSRDTIRTYLERTRHEALLSAHPSAPVRQAALGGIRMPLSCLGCPPDPGAPSVYLVPRTCSTKRWAGASRRRRSAKNVSAARAPIQSRGSRSGARPGSR